jgi:hypothetical protein
LWRAEDIGSIMADRPITPLLNRVALPADMKGLSDRELRQLADELRAETISAVSVTGGRLSAIGSVTALVDIEVDPAPNDDHSLHPSFPSVQVVGASLLQRRPEAPNEDVIDAALFAAHLDPGADPFQPARPSE